MDILWLIGRILFAAVFIVSALGHLANFKQTAATVASIGAPFPKLLSLISSLLALFGGLSIALGYRVEVGSVLLLLFLIPITFMVHRFWEHSEPEEAGNQMGHFVKNIGLIGGVLFILYLGSGPLSLG